MDVPDGVLEVPYKNARATRFGECDIEECPASAAISWVIRPRPSRKCPGNSAWGRCLWSWRRGWAVGELPGPFIRGQFRQSSHFATAFPRHGQPANAVSTRCSRPLCRRGWAGRVARASCPGPVFRRRRSHDGDPGGRTALPTFFLDIPWSLVVLEVLPATICCRRFIFGW